MSKQHRKGSGRSGDQERAPQSGDRGAEVGEQQQLGNQAALDGVDLLSDTGSELGADFVRDAAFSLVGRGILALQLLPRSPAEVERFVEIIARSHLPSDRKEALTERLQADQAAASVVQGALEALAGSDGPDVRLGVTDALEGLWTELQRGELSGDEWQSAAGVALSLSDAATTGPVDERAPALVADLGRALELSFEGAGEDVGSAVRDFCLAVHLALVFDEEEEEEEEDFGSDQILGD